MNQLGINQSLDFLNVCTEIQTLKIPKGQEVSTDELKELAMKVIKANPLSNPFSLKFNKNATHAFDKTIKWVKKFNLIPEGRHLKKFEEAKFMDLTSGAYPNSSLERLIVISDWIVFLYINDDKVEYMETKEVIDLNKRKLEILKGEVGLSEQDDSLTLALNDLMLRIRKLVNENWINRFLIKVDEHFQSTVWEAENRESKIKIPDYETYLKKRLDTGGVFTVLPFIEIAEKINIPDKIMETYLKELNRMCNNIICWSNDIKSCPKEFEESFMGNLVFVTKDKFNCSLEEAIKHSIELHNREVVFFEKSRKELYAQLDCQEDLRSYADDIRKYVEGLCHWMSSHFDFAKKSPRYN